MERQVIAHGAQKTEVICLHNMIDDLIKRISIFAAYKGNLISNDVQPDIEIHSDPGKIRLLLKRILELIVSVTKKSHIHISAKSYSDLVLVHFKEDNIHDISLIFNELKQMLQEAEKLGGFIGITSQQNSFTTIAFTFLNARNFPKTYVDRLAKTIFATASRVEEKYR